MANFCHLSPDDFALIKNIVTILEPVQEVTLTLSSESAWLGDVLPLLTSAMYRVRSLQVTSDAWVLRDALVDALTLRVQYVLGTDEPLPCSEGARLTTCHPNETVVAAYLNPRFSAAVDSYYGFSERQVSSEIERIINSSVKMDSEEEETHSSPRELERTDESGTDSNMEAADVWAAGLTASTPNSTPRRTQHRATIRSELNSFRAEITGKRFSASQTRQF